MRISIARKDDYFPI